MYVLIYYSIWFIEFKKFLDVNVVVKVYVFDMNKLL